MKSYKRRPGALGSLAFVVSLTLSAPLSSPAGDISWPGMADVRTLNGMASGAVRFGAAQGLRRAAAAAPRAASVPGGTANYFTGTGTDISSVIARTIDGARSSIQAALYELDLDNVARAFIAAHQRGVNVQILMDYSYAFPNHDAGVREGPLQALIKAGVDVRVIRGFNTYGIQHNKFAVFDGRLLETGSMNWSENSNTADYNNVIFRGDPGLVKSFAGYWNWMWSSASTIQEAAHGISSPDLGKPPSGYASVRYFKGQKYPAATFSPKGATTYRLVDLIKASQSTIDIAMFAFTSKPVAEALVEAENRGVAVRFLLDKSEASYSVGKTLLDAGIKVKILSGISGNGVMHDKFGIFDGQMLETGSYNYTNGAAFSNFENAVYETDPKTIAAFQSDFDALYSKGKPATADDLTPSSDSPPQAPLRGGASRPLSRR